MKNTVFLLIICLTFILPQTIKASHVMGGEITWKCINSGPNTGKYIFSLKTYRECGGAIFGNSQMLYSNTPSYTQIAMTLESGYPVDISPVCNSAYPQITCAGSQTSGTSNTGAISEYLYKSDTLTLNGIPPVGGWTFYWTPGARNPNTNIYGTPSVKLIAKMYAYNNTNASICLDNSPQFASTAKTVLKAGSPISYSCAAYDSDLDSLSFEWGQPLEQTGSPVSYQSGYSYTSPLPDTSINTNNIAATVDPYTGLISLSSYNTGSFYTSMKVSSYRNNQLIAEVWREIQITILSGGINSPPVVNVTNNDFSYFDTISAGESHSFIINAQDIQFLPNGTPQTMFINANGQQFGNYVANTSTPSTLDPQNGCPQIPCATLTPAPNDITPISGVFGVQTYFNWNTNCSHLLVRPNGYKSKKTYYFNFEVKDDFCPVPGANIFTYSLTVLPISDSLSNILNAEIKSVNVLPNGNIDIKWSSRAYNSNLFKYYNLYQSNSANGPYTLITNITDPNTNSYTINSGSSSTIKYYKIRTYYAICTTSQNFNTSKIFENIKLDVTKLKNCITKLEWNNTNSDNTYFNIKRKHNNIWSIIDTTYNLYYVDTFSASSVSYMVETPNILLSDSLGNTTYTKSSSNVKYQETSINIGADTSIDNNETLLINVNSDFDNHQWHNGITNNWILIHGSDFTIGDHNIWLMANMDYGCDVSDSLVLTIEDGSSSIADNNNNLSFAIFPNPSSGKFTLDIKSVDTEDLLIEVISLDGKIIYSKKANITLKEATINMDISGNAAGSYVIRISNGKHQIQKTIKLI